MITRFAPSPTGPLHLGHAYSALLAHDMARAVGGRFLLRIEDLDRTRSRPHWEEQIYRDLAWLGIQWDETPVHQSKRAHRYQGALSRLWRQGLLYPCRCTRRDIAQAASAPHGLAQGEATIGPDGPLYPGTCRPATPAHPHTPIPEDVALRLDMARALALLRSKGQSAADLGFQETGPLAPQVPMRSCLEAHEYVSTIGDVVLSRRGMGASYHLAVCLDDADSNITHVVRGQDLFQATHIHVLLQALLALPRPVYHHHRLICDEQGRRLAKRDDARAISAYREQGLSPQEIRAMINL